MLKQNWPTVVFLAGVYAAKYTINQRTLGQRWKRALFYIALLGIGLLVVYGCLEDWSAPDMEPAAHWIGGALLYLAIPFVSSLYDLSRPTVLAPRHFWFRSLCEICFFPFWKYVVAAILDCSGWIYF